MNRKKRARSIEEMDRRMSLLFTEADFSKGLELRLDPSDVVISPYAKCGTTWLQQIVHSLRTRGDMDFDDISRVVPWIETSAGLGIDLNAPQKASPRAFKSHLDADTVPAGARYLISLRHPYDALVSMHRFMEGWFLEPGAVSLEEMAHQRFIPSRAYWKHLLSWWYRRKDPDVLLLVYEHMKENLSETIVRIAEFIDIELDGELIDITRTHASLPFMLKHREKFDDLIIRSLSEEKAGLPPGSESAKVRKGVTGDGRRHLDPEVIEALDQVWREEITPVTGHRCYEELVEELRS